MPCSLSLQATEILAPTCTCTKLNAIYHSLFVKLWPIGVASRGNLKTWVYLQLHLARLCLHLHWLVMTCAHFGWDQISTQVKESFSPFGQPTQVNACWVMFINLLLANKIADSLPWNGFIAALYVHLRRNLRVRLATQRKSLRKFNLRSLATICRSVWPGLKAPRIFSRERQRWSRDLTFPVFAVCWPPFVL